MKHTGSSPYTQRLTEEPVHPSAAGEQPGFFSPQILSAQRFYLDLYPPTTSRLAVVCGGVEHCQADYHVARPDFDYYSLEFVARGEGTLVLGNRKFRLQPGVVFAYGPGVSQDMRCDAQRPLVKYFVDFSGKTCSTLLRAPAPQPGEVTQTASPDLILRLFDDLVTTGARQTPFTSRICTSILEQLILRIAESAVPLGTIGSMAFETYQQCRLHMERHYLQLHNLSDVAVNCKLDPAYLCRLFARFDRQSPYRYLMHLKMREAARRLAIPGTLAKQVAGELGFGDPFHFSRVFRRTTGVSPSQFVRMHRPVAPIDA